jgi:hypothetical protein
MLPAMKQTSPRLGDSFDANPQVTEDGDGIFDESDLKQDEGEIKLSVQDSTCRAELSW